MKTTLIIFLLLIATGICYSQSLIINKTDDKSVSFPLSEIKSITFENSPDLIDNRDWRVYKTVKIGTQVWMAENLAYLPSVSPASSGSTTSPFYYVYDYNGTDVNAAKATLNYKTYGVLYNWPAALNGESPSNSVPSGVKGICPIGWHLPSFAEWQILTNYLTNNGYGYGGSGNDIAKSIASKNLWNANTKAGTPGNDPNSNNTSGFNALGAGAKYDEGYFNAIGGSTYFRTSKDETSTHAHGIYIGGELETIADGNYGKIGGFSIRCIKN